MQSLDDIAELGKPLYEKMQAQYDKLFGHPRKRSEWVDSGGGSQGMLVNHSQGIPAMPPEICSDHETAEGIKDVWRNQQAGSE